MKNYTFAIRSDGGFKEVVVKATRYREAYEEFQRIKGQSSFLSVMFN